MKQWISGLICAVVLTAAGTVRAAEVEARIQSGSLSFAGGTNFTNAQLLITGPQGFEAEETRPRGLPQFRVQGAGRMVDGLYQYSLVAASDEKIPLQNTMNNGRGPDAPKTEFRPFAMYGTFRVEKGQILPPDDSVEGADSDATE